MAPLSYQDSGSLSLSLFVLLASFVYLTPPGKDSENTAKTPTTSDDALAARQGSLVRRATSLQYQFSEATVRTTTPPSS